MLAKQTLRAMLIHECILGWETWTPTSTEGDWVVILEAVGSLDAYIHCRSSQQTHDYPRGFDVLILDGCWVIFFFLRPQIGLEEGGWNQMPKVLASDLCFFFGSICEGSRTGMIEWKRIFDRNVRVGPSSRFNVLKLHSCSCQLPKPSSGGWIWNVCFGLDNMVN